MESPAVLTTSSSTLMKEMRVQMIIVVVPTIVQRKQQMQIFGKRVLTITFLCKLSKYEYQQHVSFVYQLRGDFCPYVHTGPNAGKYRHPHVALAAIELWFANKCHPEMCPSEWLKTPNAKDYGVPERSTSITWAEMIDNEDPMSQPVVPYKWPNSGSGSYPGHELYTGLNIKPVGGVYVNEVTASNASPSTFKAKKRRKKRQTWKKQKGKQGQKKGKRL